MKESRVRGIDGGFGNNAPRKLTGRVLISPAAFSFDRFHLALKLRPMSSSPQSADEPVPDLIAGADFPANAVYAKFETELQVRPDDIDMYQHVHSSRYMDYVLAARFEQMERCYKMPMAEFQRLGYGWFMTGTQMNFKRPLGMGDRFTVRTWIEKFTLVGLRVQFEIDRAGGKRCCDGWFDYVMVSIETARAVRIPAGIRAKYSI
jgi:acyl-CoA thioester hydrolase/thioesterase-3